MCQQAILIEACKQAGGEKLIQVNLFDVYQGIGVASGHKSLAISLTIQDNEKTLEDDEINAVISAVLNEVKQRFNADLRRLNRRLTWQRLQKLILLNTY